VSIIKAVGVSILYLTGDFKDIGLKEYVMRRLKGNYHVTQFWADRNINFSLERGDMLGIIGTNGAGKSTLLKAVSGIMVPTEGHMEINGSIAALLELASGFDPELTVRENTYLRGAMLGYTRKFMNDKYEEIIDFAELQGFQDRPFKQLSSGMKSRLAFSIACLVHPDILILDEVLSVGDGAFAKKSGDRMREILKSGVTGILVSHSVPQVRDMCNKILWLDHGHQVGFSDQVEIYCDAYEEFLTSKKLPHNENELKKMAQNWNLRKQKQKKINYQSEEKRLEAVLNSENPEVALNVAISFIKKEKPEILKSSI
jgi:ABC-2 type transport system ATP-binding protein